MKAIRFLALTVIEMMIATSFSWSQEKISPSLIPFTNEIGCEETYDTPTFGEMMASSDTLYGDKRELVLQELEEAFSASEDYVPEYEVPAYEVIVLTPRGQDAEDEYAIQQIVVKQDKDGDIISLYIHRKDGWLRGDPEYGSLLYLDLAAYVSFLQHHMFIDSQHLR
jgi:hypothetical protein